MPINKELFESIRKKFFTRLDRKTGWGKVEIKEEYINAVNEALLEFIKEES